VLSEENEIVSFATNKIITFAKTHSNFIITPHIGGCTHDAMERTEVFIAEKVTAYIDRNKIECA
jgi:D-3-phosphoglycerate dehydrogenase